MQTQRKFLGAKLIYFQGVHYSEFQEQRKLLLTGMGL